MRHGGASPVVDDLDRMRKKVEEAERLRALTPAGTIEMGFQLMEFARELSKAADRAHG